MTLIFSHCKGKKKNKQSSQDNDEEQKNKIGITPKINIPKVTLEVVGTKLLVNNIKSNPTIEALSLSSRIIKEENVDKDDYEGFVILKYGVFFHQVQEDLKQALEQCTIAQGIGTMLVQNKALVFLKSNQGDDYKNMITSDNINALNIKSDVSLDVCYWKRYKDHFVVISNAYKMKVEEVKKNQNKNLNRSQATTSIIQPESVNTSQKQEDRCTICIKKIIEDRIMLKCEHTFHSKCLISWYYCTPYPDCPNCRREIGLLDTTKLLVSAYS